MKVEEIIAEPIKLHNPSIKNTDLKIIFDLLSRAIANSATRYPYEFSGGQSKEFQYKSTSYTARLLVCDEPTSALDVSIRTNIKFIKGPSGTIKSYYIIH